MANEITPERIAESLKSLTKAVRQLSDAQEAAQHTTNDETRG